jgi:hypothetical protein
MNLRVQSGLAHSHPALDAFLISLDSLLPSPAAERHFQFILHRPARRELRFQFSTGLPTGWRVGLFNLWIQVQKVAKPVDFTMCGALIEVSDSDLAGFDKMSWLGAWNLGGIGLQFSLCC